MAAAAVLVPTLIQSSSCQKIVYRSGFRRLIKRKNTCAWEWLIGVAVMVSVTVRIPSTPLCYSMPALSVEVIEYIVAFL